MSSAKFLPDFDTGEIYLLVAVGRAADRNGDGLLDFFDVQDFLVDFAAQDTWGDINGDLLFDFFDVAAFLQAFSAGCP